jgi:L-threonylcarbamoyladenylate synthase
VDALTAEEVRDFVRCISAGGLALFPADTVYGLATNPDSREGVERLYRVKGRDIGRPTAVMFFRIDLAHAAMPELAGRTRAAVDRLLPGGVTVIVPNPLHRYPLACGPEPERLGLRVPVLEDRLAPLEGMTLPVLQSSANPSGRPEARRLAAVDPGISREVDVALDGGVLEGTPSTVVDLTRYEEAGDYEVLREGAVPAGEVATKL